MADEVGLKVKLDGKEVERGAKKAGDAIERNFKNSATKAVSSVRKITNSIFSLKGAVAGVAFGFATKQVADFTAELIKAGSDAEETANKFNVVFKGIGEEALEATNNLRKGFGLANEESQRLLSNTADILTGFGFTKKSALELSTATQRLAGDLGSFNNLSTADASERLTKALTGEVESLKALGIVIRQDTKEYKNLVKSIKETEGVSLLQAKALANIRIATEQSQNAIGDFSRSIDSFANQSRIATSRFQDMKVELGKALLPVANDVLRNTLIPAMDDLSKTIVENKDNIQEFATKGVEFLRSLKEPASALLSILELSAEGYIKIAEILEIYNQEQEQQKKINEAYKSQNRTLQQQAIILTNTQQKLENIKKLAPSEGRARLIADYNQKIKEQTEELNRLSKEYTELNKSKSEFEKPTADKQAVEAPQSNKSTQVSATLELTKANNQYIESLNKEYEQMQFLKELSGQFTIESLEGRALAIAQLQDETAELKNQAALKIEDKEILENTITSIEEREVNRRKEIRKDFDDLDEKLSKQEIARNVSKNAMIANMTIGAFKDIFGENQAFASASAIVDTYVAANKALASVPPPYNFALAGLVTAAGLKNVAEINGIGFADGTEFVTGSGGPRTDSVRARLSEGERVFTNNQNNELNGLSNEDVIDIVRNGGNSLGFISDLFSGEEIAQKIIDYIELANQSGLTVQA